MAEVAGAIYVSHASWVTRPWNEWNQERAVRRHREDVPVDDDDQMAGKAARMSSAVSVLTRKIEELEPDLLIIFGDDQYECFNFDNFPAISIYLGEEFEGRVTRTERRNVSGHAPFASALLAGLLERDFDPAFSMKLAHPERGMSHAIMFPLNFFDVWSIPTVPILMNAYYAPQVTARRHYKVGCAVREIIDDYPEDLRVVVIGSGGLWHTPRRRGAYLDEEFDQRGLEFLRTGRISAWAEFFDSYRVPEDDSSQNMDDEVPEGAMMTGDQVTHLPGPGGPQSGTRETCNWISAAGVVDGRPTTIVDYVPVYAAPIGVGFAYCDDI